MSPSFVGYVSGVDGRYYPYYSLSPCGGDGGYGWWPYSLPSRIGASVASSLFTSGAITLTNDQVSAKIFNFAVSVGNSSMSSTAASTQAGGTGGCAGYLYNNTYQVAVGGAGGIGYGAGGGGGASTSRSSYTVGGGGNGGQVITHNLILSSSQATTTHTITVGAGGTTTRTNYTGGDGANGCVAVFW